MITKEFNFDGLVGPTHNYAGLSSGNIASKNNQGNVSNPKQAAKQGLRKMKALHDLGLAQAVLPPQERPDVALLRQSGFYGTEKQVIEKAAKSAPALFEAACSASSMWTANSATVSPSADTLDGKLHLTPANLINKLHRSIEATTTKKILSAIFDNEQFFTVHDPLPAHESFGDEGAANHTRFCTDYGSDGMEMFVYGQSYFNQNSPRPKLFPARQTLEACEAVIRLHKLKPDSSLVALQNPNIIDQGVFHNDVIAVGNQNLLFYHQQAFADEKSVKQGINAFFKDQKFHFIRVEDNRVSLEDAIKSYLFNSQIVSLGPDNMALVLPQECQKNRAVWDYLQDLKQADNPIQDLIVKDLKQSMANGGGPACLRLRVVMNQTQVNALNQQVIMSENLFTQLDQWIDKHYRDRLDLSSLADPNLLDECRTALDELTGIMNLGRVYPFQLD